MMGIKKPHKGKPMEAIGKQVGDRNSLLFQNFSLSKFSLLETKLIFLYVFIKSGKVIYIFLNVSTSHP